nr:hypothetical protein [Candidatus Sigynarchaeum springense]MDO8116582.1 hypothetical protein [Candidatus Sigynarchaeota archaeon]
MENTVVLSIFDDRTGFKPEYFYPEERDIEMIKRVIFQATLFLVGGTEDLKTDRESILDLPEHNLIGVTHMTSAPSPGLRGGNMPIVVIYVTPSENRGKIYNNIVPIMEMMRDVTHAIKGNWSGSKFSDKKKIKILMDRLGPDIDNIVSQFAETEKNLETSMQIFEVICPDCSTSTILKVPRNIKDFLAIPVVNIPCNHEFEAYFTKGPTPRGTSPVKKKEAIKDEIRDIFTNL